MKPEHILRHLILMVKWLWILEASESRSFNRRRFLSEQIWARKKLDSKRVRVFGIEGYVKIFFFSEYRFHLRLYVLDMEGFQHGIKWKSLLLGKIRRWKCLEKTSFNLGDEILGNYHLSVCLQSLTWANFKRIMKYENQLQVAYGK